LNPAFKLTYSAAVRFSANLGFLWPELPLLARIEAAAKAGFKAIELHWPYDVPAEAVKASCAQHGMRLLAVNTIVGDPAKGEFGLGALPGRERDFQAAVAQSIAYCKGSGATAVHAMAGVVPRERREEAGRVLMRNLSEAADAAAAAGLTLLIEPINPRDKPDYFFATPDDAAEVIWALDRSNVKLLFDAYHVAVACGDVIMRLRRYISIIGHVQIAAVPSRAEPDEGEIAYRFIFAELNELGYDGWIGCEYRPRAGTDAGLAWTNALQVSL
jgi:hydroxypyruvate isomerase